VGIHMMNAVNVVAVLGKKHVSVTIEASDSGNLTASSLVYLTAHDAASGSVNDQDNCTFGQAYLTAVFLVIRGGLIFDTSAIPASVDILEAFVSLQGALDMSVTDFLMTIVDGSELTDPLVGTNFGDLLDSIVSLGEKDSSTFVIDNWNAIDLNAAGIAAIVKGGTTKFGVRSSRDISALTPKLDGGDATEYVGGYGTYPGDPKPRLTILYEM